MFEVASGEHFKSKVNDEQLDVDLDVIQPGCGVDESRISIRCEWIRYPR